MKLWGLGGETMALLVRKYGSFGFAFGFAVLRSTDNRQQTTDLWAVAGVWASLMLRSTTVNGQQTTDL